MPEKPKVEQCPQCQLSSEVGAYTSEAGIAMMACGRCMIQFRSHTPTPAPEPTGLPTFRQWLIDGGGGHEDGEDGIRACTLPLESAIELVDDYLDTISVLAIRQHREAAPAAAQGAPPLDKYDVRPFAPLPDKHVAYVEEWLNANEKNPLDVKWSLFPIGMVRRWIERAESAESAQGAPAANAGGDGWISVEERLPEIGKEVLAGAYITAKWADGRTQCNFQQALQIWTGEKWIDSDSGEEDGCTHWMPLPSSPVSRKD